jgi:tRNA U34 5-methylaminomethyl-2-thiouridine-forming methyltransferase MnmC
MHTHERFDQNGFQFNLFIGDVLEFIPEIQYDLVYFDAFAPQAQPEMWATDIFSKLISWISPGAILVTYCAQGQFKRTLKSLGFEVESLPGPPGKREMVRAKI